LSSGGIDEASPQVAPPSLLLLLLYRFVIAKNLPNWDAWYLLWICWFSEAEKKILHLLMFVFFEKMPANELLSLK